MDVKQYVINKGMETASIEMMKLVIQEDISLSQNTKQEFISTINMFVVVEILKLQKHLIHKQMQKLMQLK